jgi:hypothetical protein
MSLPMIQNFLCHTKGQSSSMTQIQIFLCSGYPVNGLITFFAYYALIGILVALLMIPIVILLKLQCKPMPPNVSKFLKNYFLSVIFISASLVIVALLAF